MREREFGPFEVMEWSEGMRWWVVIGQRGKVAAAFLAEMEFNIIVFFFFSEYQLNKITCISFFRCMGKK